ncbi:MAG TPA: hypothetical protein VMW24_06155, partial [Sedimentisphaerales bacterium]|nr:hypothetical protein [Sedimentisphaerales bacterium]
MKKSLVLVVIGMLLICPAVLIAARSGQNIIVNSSFEQAEARNPTGWKIQSWGMATGIARFGDVNLQLLSTDVPSPRRPEMYYTDDSHGRAFAKDPDVAHFGGRYLMYYTISRPGKGIAIG